MIVWLAFLLFIGILLALDLGVFHRKAHVVSVREALGWTAIWLTTALLFVLALRLAPAAPDPRPGGGA